MTRLFIIATSMVMSCLFMVFSPTGTIGFPFSEMVLTSETWFYFLFEHLILVLLSLIIYELEPKYRVTALVFLLVQCVDTVDYCLTYGERWTPYLPSWNVLKLSAIGLSIVFDLTKKSWKAQHS